MNVYQREHPQVFRTACGLLGLDHIGEVGDDDLHVPDSQAMGVDRKLSIAAGAVAYDASKGAIEAMTRSLAIESWRPTASV